jgi:hypothetical protein
MFGLYWLFLIFLMIAGALAAYPGIVSARPDARQVLDKILPYQGILGIIVLIWGVANLLYLLFHFFLLTLPVLLAVASDVVGILLGIILGYGLIAQHALANNADWRRKGENFRSKLLGRQVALGWAGIILGIVGLIRYLLV